MPDDVRDDELAQSSGGRMRVARSRGALSGVLLILLGAWGALVPFVGPYFHFAYTPDKTWHWTAARGWFEVLPGGVAVVGGLLLVFSASRLLTSLGGWLAAAAGGWFVVGPTMSYVLTLGSIGVPVSPGVVKQTLEVLTLFSGLGAVIVLVAAVGIGRLSIRSVRDVKAALRRDADDSDAPAVVPAPEPISPEPIAEVPVAEVPVAGEPSERPGVSDEPVATTQHSDGAYAPGGHTPTATENPEGWAAAMDEPARAPGEPLPEPVERDVGPDQQQVPGFGQRVPTYYQGGPPVQESVAPDDEGPPDQRPA